MRHNWITTYKILRLEFTFKIMNSKYPIIFWFFNGKNNILWMALLWITSLGLENVTIALLIVGINANLFLDLIICKVRLGILVINTWRLIWNNSKFCINYYGTWFSFFTPMQKSVITEKRGVVIIQFQIVNCLLWR